MDRTSARRLHAFTLVSLDGYYCDAAGDMSFAHKAPDDVEWNEFLAGNTSGESVLLFGRTTYDLMVQWWPTPAALQAMPAAARSINAQRKVVFSRTLKAATWNNTVIERDAVTAVRRLKSEPGPDLVVLGSGSILTQLADAGLLDAQQLVVSPIALGAGKALFAGLKTRRAFTLTKHRAFGNGSIVLWYEAAA